MLEDIDPTSNWVVESDPTEFDSDEDIHLDLDLHMEALVEPKVQLNADPLVPVLAPSPPVAGKSSTQPQHRHIARLSQRATLLVLLLLQLQLEMLMKRSDGFPLLTLKSSLSQMMLAFFAVVTSDVLL